MRFLLAPLLALVLLAATGCGTESDSPSDLRVTEAWARPASDSGRPSAAYFTLHNDGGRLDTLLGARTPASRTVEMHESTTDERGVMRMRPVEHVPLPPGDSVAFGPGGLHLMLIDLTRPLAPGDRVPLTLSFAQQDSVEVKLEVRRP